MKQFRIFFLVILISLLIPACSNRRDDANTLIYKVTGEADQVSILFTTETGASEKIVVAPPWEKSFDIGSSFIFSLQVDNLSKSGSVNCEVWINGKRIGEVTGMKFAKCTGSFSGDGDTHSSSFISNSDAGLDTSPEETVDNTSEDSSELATTPKFGLEVVNEITVNPDLKVWVSSIAWSSDGTQILSGTVKGDLQMWDTATGDQLFVFNGIERVINSLSWSPDGTRIASTSLDGTVRVWDAGSGEQLQKIETGDTFSTDEVDWSPDSKLLAVAVRNTIRLWEADTGIEIPVAFDDGSEEKIKSVAWSPDGTQLVTGGYDDQVYLWDAITGDLLFVFGGEQHKKFVSRVAWSPNGTQIISVSGDGTIRLWDVSTATLNQTIVWEVNSPYELGIYDVSLSPDGTLVAAAGATSTVYNGYIGVWDIMTGDKKFEFKETRDRVFDVIWSPDGTQLAYAVGNMISLWNVSNSSN